MSGEHEDCISWNGHFMGVAHLLALRSRDPNTQANAYIVGDDNKTLSMDYGGLPRGYSDDEFPWRKEREQNDPYQVKYFYATHNELNAILNYCGGSLEGSELYVTLFPCNECVKAVIQSDIRTLTYGEDKYGDTAVIRVNRHMSNAVGVCYYQHIKTGRKLQIIA